jgi:hypothetical protein
MKPFAFVFVLLFCAVAPAFAQITPIAVSPQPLPGVQRTPLRVAAAGSRLFGVFNANFGPNLYYSDNAGANWLPTPAFPGQPEDVLVAGNRLYVSIRAVQGDVHTLQVYVSDDNAGSFSLLYSIDEIRISSNGNYENLTAGLRLFEANNTVFFTYYSSTKNANDFYDYLRGVYSTDSGVSWKEFDPGTKVLGPAENFLYFAGHYIVVTDRAKYGSSTEQRVYCAPAPDFSGYWVLPDVFFPLASGVVNNTLYIIGNGKLYWRTDVQAGTKFSTANIPFTVWSAAVLKDHFYYFTRNGIRRAAAADPFSTQTVFLGVFDNGIQGGGFPKFATAGGTLYLLSYYPLLSIDDGQNWSPWPISADLPWAGKVFSAGNQLFLDNAWVMNSTNGIDFNLWKPQGISELDYLEWQTMVAHKGYLFLKTSLYASSSGVTDAAVLRSIDQGQNWSPVFQSPNGYPGYLYAQGTRLYFAAQPDGGGPTPVHYSDDAGLTWNPFSQGGPAFIYGFAASGDTAYCLQSSRLYYTYNLGQTWDTTQLNTGTWSIFYYKGILVATDEYSGKVLASNDGGQSFYQIIDFTPSGRYEFWQVADSILLGKNTSSSTLFAAKIGSINWVSFGVPKTWQNMTSFAVFGDHLYGSQNNGGLYWPDLSPFSRIPLDQILDPLDALSTKTGIISGKLHFDVLPNCNQDTNEPALAGHIVRMQPGNYFTATNPDGTYGIALPPGAYQISVDTPKYHLPACHNFSANVVAGQTTGNKNAGFRPIGPVKDLQVLIAGTRLRPGMTSLFTLQVNNAGTQSTPAGVLLRFAYQAGPLDFGSSNPAYTTFTPGEIEFSLPEILPYQSVKIRVVLQLEPNPGLTGQTFFFSAEIVDNYLDANTSDNTYTLPMTVTNSFDPNDKTAFGPTPKGDQVTLKDAELQYLIRFQNTGTDTAFRVVIRDTLQARFDPSSIRTLASSHPCRFSLRHNNLAEWHFDPIALPDSTTSEPNSHGFVLFSLRASKKIRVGDELKNQASIFFDFNDPVLTNTTRTKVVRNLIYRDAEPAEHRNRSARVFPNPAVDRANFEIDSPATGGFLLELRDMTGRLVQRHYFEEYRFSVSCEGMPAGSYAWVVYDESGAIGEGVVLIR